MTREPHRVIVRSQAKGQGLLKGLAAIAAVAIFGIYPAVGALQQIGGTLGFPWSAPSTCDGLRYRYEVARDAIGAPKAGAARGDFTSARSSCERFVSVVPSASRTVSCNAAIRTYERALRRVERQKLGVASAEPLGGFAGASRTFRSRANEVLGTDDVQADERLANMYLDACTG
ncbi:MAG: hypothetical protein ACREQJ_03305 [Candidatus Binatia bacterium]